MSIKAMTKVWDQSRQEGSNLLLMLALADYADDQGRSFPAVSTLAKKVRLGDRQVRYILRKLEEDGEIKTLTGIGYNGTNVYQLTVGMQPSAGGGVQPSAGGGCSPVQGGDAADCTRSVIDPPMIHSATDVAGEATPSLSEQIRLALIAMNTSKNRIGALGDLHTLCFGYPPTDWPRLGAMCKKYGGIAVARTFVDMLASPPPDTLGAATLRLEGRKNAKKTTGKEADGGAAAGTGGVRGKGKGSPAGRSDGPGRNSSGPKAGGGPIALVPFDDD